MPDVKRTPRRQHAETSLFSFISFSFVRACKSICQITSVNCLEGINSFKNRILISHNTDVQSDTFKPPFNLLNLIYSHVGNFIKTLD